MSELKFSCGELIEAFFDGKIFKPRGKVNLAPNRQYFLQVKACQKKPEDAFEVLKRLTGTVEAPEDWALNHDHYLYGETMRKTNG